MLQALTTALLALTSPTDAPQVFDALDADARTRLQACAIDAEQLDTLLALQARAFDQDFSGGWRPYGNDPDCQRAAADLIIAYIDHSPHYDQQSHAIIRWHAGQMLATADERGLAVEYLDSARGQDAVWNLYVDATIAFLRRDREAAEAARAALASELPSEEEMEARRQFLMSNPRIRVPDGFVERPQNLDVVDRLLECWDHPYSRAYGGC